MRNKNENNKNNEKKKELTIFTNDKFGDIRTVLINGEPYFVGKDVANALGYKDTSDALKKHVSNDDKLTRRFADSGQNRSMITINESGLYSLIFSSKLESAIEFKHWVTSEVLPTIRKTGGYVNNDELFIETYLPFADDNTKLLFSTTLETVRKQNELIKKQQKEIVHKQEVINGLTDNIPIYEKPDIINRICRKSSGGYADRYKELYKCFRENFHTDLVVKCKNYNEKQEKKKDHLTVIRYAEKFGHIDDLYSCCVKLYESEVKQIIKELYEVQE